jgi:hypothetical protein
MPINVVTIKINQQIKIQIVSLLLSFVPLADKTKLSKIYCFYE